MAFLDAEPYSALDGNTIVVRGPLFNDLGMWSHMITYGPRAQRREIAGDYY
jgi:hypothetical protein